MAVKTLLSQTGVVGAGPIQSFPGADDVRIVQFNPQVGIGFSGSVVIEGSYAARPSSNDFQALATVTFTGHTANFSLDIDSDAPWVRARVATASVGAISVYGDSRLGAISGGQSGAGSNTAIIDSQLKAAGTGTNFRINSPVVPQFTTDDVIYVNDFSKTLTDILDGTNGAVGKQNKIGTGAITANQNDVNVLTGTAAYGLTVTDMQKVADITVSATEVNRLAGISSNVQTQLNSIAASVPTSLTGTTVTASSLNSFFNVTPTVNMTNLNNLSGLTASAADMNVLAGHALDWTGDDIVKLGDVTASATDLNRISGFSGNSSDLNKLVGMNSSTADLNAISGLAGTGVSTTQLAFLIGLNTNVQSALNAVPNLAGLTASVNDLNTLTGIFTGSGAFPAQISSTELGYLEGASSNIQAQLNNRRSIGVPIGIAEISGAAITTTELNYLQGATSNIQAQINAISSSSITPAGGNFSGPVGFADGTAAAPSIRFTADTDTGFYRVGGNTLGFAANATRIFSLSTAQALFGNGITNGAPALQHTGFGAGTPAYQFVNDGNTGMYWISADSIGFAVGGNNILTLDGVAATVTVGGATNLNNSVVVSGKFAGEKLLGVATVQAGLVTGATGQTTIYTVPAGRSAIVTKILVRITNRLQGGGTGSTSAFRMNIGVSPQFDELLDNTNNVTVFNPGAYSFSTVGQVMPLGVGDNAFPAICGANGADYQVFTAGAIIRANVTVQAQFDQFDLQLIAFGYEF